MLYNHRYAALSHGTRLSTYWVAARCETETIPSVGYSEGCDCTSVISSVFRLLAASLFSIWPYHRFGGWWHFTVCLISLNVCWLYMSLRFPFLLIHWMCKGGHQSACFPHMGTMVTCFIWKWMVISLSPGTSSSHDILDGSEIDSTPLGKCILSDLYILWAN